MYHASHVNDLGITKRIVEERKRIVEKVTLNSRELFIKAFATKPFNYTSATYICPPKSTDFSVNI
jgi:hypothetical protein